MKTLEVAVIKLLEDKDKWRFLGQLEVKTSHSTEASRAPPRQSSAGSIASRHPGRDESGQNVDTFLPYPRILSRRLNRCQTDDRVLP